MTTSDTLRLSKRDLYRFPWSFNDNPIGWLEITDRCNIYCKGCYRKNGVAGHKPLEEIEREIDTLREWRNCDNITIAGGEPLIHPEIVDIVRAVHRRKMKPLILSNGVEVLKRPELVRELKKAGLLGFTFHVDSEQNRPHWRDRTEMELCELRLELAKAVAAVGGLWASFGMTVYPGNIDTVPDLVSWANDHIDIVHGLVFITFSGLPQDGSFRYRVHGHEVDASKIPYATPEAGEIHVTSEDVWRCIKEAHPGYEASAYLGGTQSHDRTTWLTGVQIGRPGKTYGSFGAKATEIVQSLHHLFHGTYHVYMYGNKVTRLLWLLSLFDRGVRRAHGAFWRDVLRNPLRLFRAPRISSIGIVQGPDVLADGRYDMCESCPDMTLWNGEFVHSCRLEEWRLFGGYVEGSAASAAVPEIPEAWTAALPAVEATEPMEPTART